MSHFPQKRNEQKWDFQEKWKNRVFARIGEGVNERERVSARIAWFNESLVVTTCQKGKYVDSIRQVHIKLINMKVGRNNVKEIIETVLGDLKMS